MNINDFLNNYFKEHKISQREVIKKTGISQSKVSLMLNGKRKITAEELIKIVIEFDIDLCKIKKILSINTPKHTA